ncbi:hypothetical protein HN446_01765 [bacterium]|jgi:hypothetical protein|nr:hypothetical protein [bacterium]
MKPINFIKPFPPGKQIAITRWFKLSVLSIVSLVFILAFIQLNKYKKHLETYNKKEKLFNKISKTEKEKQKRQKAKKEKLSIEKQINHLKALSNPTETPYKIIENIFNTANKHNLSIKTISKQADATNTNGHAEKIKKITEFAHSLEQPTNEIHIKSIKTVDKKRIEFLVSIKNKG